MVNKSIEVLSEPTQLAISAFRQVLLAKKKLQAMQEEYDKWNKLVPKSEVEVYHARIESMKRELGN
jgi:hypothetical protein